MLSTPRYFLLEIEMDNADDNFRFTVSGLRQAFRSRIFTFNPYQACFARKFIGPLMLKT